jgi:hypothetical protein
LVPAFPGSNPGAPAIFTPFSLAQIGPRFAEIIAEA